MFKPRNSESKWLSKSRNSMPRWSPVQINENRHYPGTRSTWHGAGQLPKTAKTVSSTSTWFPRKRAQDADGTMMEMKYSSNRKNPLLSHLSQLSMEKASSQRRRSQASPLKTGSKQWKIWSSRRKTITSIWTCTTNTELKSVKISKKSEKQSKSICFKAWITCWSRSVDRKNYSRSGMRCSVCARKKYLAMACLRETISVSCKALLCMSETQTAKCSRKTVKRVRPSNSTKCWTILHSATATTSQVEKRQVAT